MNRKKTAAKADVAPRQKMQGKNEKKQAEKEKTPAEGLDTGKPLQRHGMLYLLHPLQGGP